MSAYHKWSVLWSLGYAILLFLVTDWSHGSILFSSFVCLVMMVLIGVIKRRSEKPTP